MKYWSCGKTEGREDWIGKKKETTWRCEERRVIRTDKCTKRRRGSMQKRKRDSDRNNKSRLVVSLLQRTKD
jgi:hypothetical protein